MWLSLRNLKFQESKNQAATENCKLVVRLQNVNATDMLNNVVELNAMLL